MVFYLNQFRGGYTTDLPPERQEDEMLTECENVYWRNKLVSRQGKKNLLASSDSNTVHGMARAYLNSNWYTVGAKENASGDIEFLTSTNSGANWASIDSTYSWSGTFNQNIEMAVFGTFVIAVHPENKPAVIYYGTSDIVIENLETYDTRTRTDSDWYAGQYTASGSTYTDDTDDAQAATVDFQLVSTATGDGFFVAGDLTYNKYILNDAESLGVTGDATFQYYKGSSTWGTMDLVATPDFNPGSTSDISIEFNYPTDWEVWDGSEDILNSRFVTRVTFGVPPAAAKSCGLIQVYHTQYLTQIMAGAYPSQVEVHLNRLYLAEGNNVNFSPPERLTGWNEYDVEVFIEGGEKVLAMRSMGQFLSVIKSSVVYGYFGNVWENREVRLLSRTGTVRGRTCAVVNDQLFYLARDGIRGMSDLNTFILSKHIDSDLSSYTKTNACAVNYKGEYFLGFPSNDVVLMFDPDTLRRDDQGDMRASIYKLKGLTPLNMVWQSDQSDDGYLLAYEAGVLNRYETGNYYDENASGTVNVDIQLKTKEYSFGTMQMKKRYRRTKLETNKYGAFTFTLHGEYGTVSKEIKDSSGSGSGHFDTEYSVPYEIDGMNMAFEIEASVDTQFILYGIAIDVERRPY